MDIVYPEYAALIIFLIIAVWRILKDTSDEEESRRIRRSRGRLVSGDNENECAYRKE